MPKTFAWGPVSRPNAATGRGLWLLTPHATIIGHVFPQTCGGIHFRLRVGNTIQPAQIYSRLSQERFLCSPVSPMNVPVCQRPKGSTFPARESRRNVRRDGRGPGIGRWQTRRVRRHPDPRRPEEPSD